MTTSHVYAAISEVAAKISKEGIGKDRNNQQQNYKFRGIDDMYNALAPLLATAGLVILPRVVSHKIDERTTQKGTPLFCAFVDVEFDFVSAKDGSKHTCRLTGEAMDMADKATNKAMSAAYKYLCMQAFCIPTEGDNDADATTHEPAARQQPQPKPAAQAVAQQHGLKTADQVETPVQIAQRKFGDMATWEQAMGEVQSLVAKLNGQPPNRSQQAILACGADRLTDLVESLDDCVLIETLCEKLNPMDKERIKNRLASWAQPVS